MINYNKLEKQFLDFWKIYGEKTLLGYKKSGQLFFELVSVINLEGNTAEIGVFEGYTSKLIHAITPNKVHYCYDTFCGIKGSTEENDIHKNGEFYCSIDNVKKTIDMENVIYKVGYFPDTFDENNEKFCFVHSDTDTYEGTKNTILYFKDKIVSGGKIIFDDYCWEKCPGVEKALKEFNLHDTEFIHKAMPKYNQYVIIKK
jgi:hypothetical protein